MVNAIRTLTIDCHDPYALAQFWQQVLEGYAEDPDDPNNPDDPAALLRGPLGAPGLLFIPVPEAKSLKNRLHLDIAPTDATRDDEVVRLVRLGATLVDDRRNPDGTGWAVMADPEGNEFCVMRSQSERDQ